MSERRSAASSTASAILVGVENVLIVDIPNSGLLCIRYHLHLRTTRVMLHHHCQASRQHSLPRRGNVTVSPIDDQARTLRTLNRGSFHQCGGNDRSASGTGTDGNVFMARVVMVDMSEMFILMHSPKMVTKSWTNMIS